MVCAHTSTARPYIELLHLVTHRQRVLRFLEGRRGQKRPAGDDAVAATAAADEEEEEEGGGSSGPSQAKRHKGDNGEGRME